MLPTTGSDCSLVDVCYINNYEAQAAIELESLASDITVEKIYLKYLLKISATIRCYGKTTASNLWHSHLAYALMQWLDKSAQQRNINTIILSGG
ncbi:hypothetical protein ACH24_06225 [Francisella persica ATCC VR-331]|uniref:Carbamoyltransferase Kae1-like domain-containing protein n=1 Tax=Francisella persica ATCC VR-331 TaxID=1086726 RepID=A0AAC8ZN01_9GAMM|nr:hypothetical protein [Francisella persica]ALB02176.1 hypothetical protein ACH24_06225 [Francisella persica ATCC VR-331]ANH77437.1 hypothetical protein FSC845_02305 [Francisella persica ATCC VR-331]